MGAVTTLFRVPVSTASILFNVAPRIVSTLIVDRKNERGLFPSRRWLLMDRHFLFVLSRPIALFSGSTSASRSRAFGLLDCRHLEQSLHLVSDASSLGVRWLWHVPQQHCCRHNVLARSRETVDGLLRFCISDDLPVYLSSSSADTPTGRVGQILLEDLLEQDKALAILVKLCLELS